jgi:hypothetical protein
MKKILTYLERTALVGILHRIIMWTMLIPALPFLFFNYISGRAIHFRTIPDDIIDDELLIEYIKREDYEYVKELLDIMIQHNRNLKITDLLK